MASRIPHANVTSTPNGLRVLLPAATRRTTESASRSNNSINISGISSLDDSEECGPQMLRELGNIKDSIECQVDKKMEEAGERVSTLQDELKALRSEVEDLRKANQNKKATRKLPKGLSKTVRMIYNGLESGWIIGERYKSSHNVDVSTRALQGVTDLNLEFEVCDINRALYRYFENLKRQDKDGEKFLVVKRRASRRFRLFEAREKVEKFCVDLEMWEKANPFCMSDEETDEEDGYTRKVFRRLPWRNVQFDELVERIDVALGIRRLYSRHPSEREINYSKVPPELRALDVVEQNLETQ